MSDDAMSAKEAFDENTPLVGLWPLQEQWAAEDKVRVERDRYAEALREIRVNEGKVCDHYEVCDHRACSSSYTAWAIADAALSPFPSNNR